MAIALLMVAWSQVTITDPLPDLIAASSTKDHVNVREDPTVCGANPVAVLRTRVGDQYSIEHVCRRPRRRNLDRQPIMCAQAQLSLPSD